MGLWPFFRNSPLKKAKENSLGLIIYNNFKKSFTLKGSTPYGIPVLRHRKLNKQQTPCTFLLAR